MEAKTRHKITIGLWPWIRQGLLASMLLMPAAATVSCSSTLVPLTQDASVAGLLRVHVEGVEGNVIKIRVWNDSLDTIVVDRDKIRLLTYKLTQSRLPDGLPSTVKVAKDTSQPFHVAFDLGDFKPIDEIWLTIDLAISINDKEIPLQRLQFAVK